MTRDHVKQKLIGVLRTIQLNSGLACPELTGSLRPMDELERFDSKVWPVAIGMLAVELNIEIAIDLNIFVSVGGTAPLSIDEIATLVCTLPEIGAIPKVAAE
jgi:hypothetical protein